ncbi:MAG: GNAT family N-acetyltransferase [Pseudomonadota bacterium]
MIEVGVTQDIEACLAIRRVVFIEEQNVDEAIEMDGLEHQGIHVLLTHGGTPAGCARLMIKGHIGRIGRVAVLKEFRGLGLGKAVMEECARILKAMPGVNEAQLGAQTYAIPFYESLGYHVDGDEYIDANIPHRPMVMPL